MKSKPAVVPMKKVEGSKEVMGITVAEKTTEVESNDKAETRMAWRFMRVGELFSRVSVAIHAM